VLRFGITLGTLGLPLEPRQVVPDTAVVALDGERTFLRCVVLPLRDGLGIALPAIAAKNANVHLAQPFPHLAERQGVAPATDEVQNPLPVPVHGDPAPAIIFFRRT